VRATPVPRGTPTGGVPTRTQNAPAGWRLGALLERGASSVQRNPGLPSERFDVLAGPLASCVSTHSAMTSYATTSVVSPVRLRSWYGRRTDFESRYSRAACLTRQTARFPHTRHSPKVTRRARRDRTRFHGIATGLGRTGPGRILRVANDEGHL